MKLRKKISLILIALITCGVLFAWISPIKLVRVNHEAFFTEDFYYYMIEIYEQNQLYFRNVNKNEISLTRVTPANVANGTEYFLTFQDSIEIKVFTETYITSKYFTLNKYTKIKIRPNPSFTIFNSSSENSLQDH